MSFSNSPFTDRLNTNYIPSDSEILQIRALLVDPVEEVARIDAQIAEMELALTQLREKRALLQKPIDAHNAPHIAHEARSSGCSSGNLSLLYWRSVAYSTPILWSSIHIPPLDYLSTPPDVLLGLERLVATWLERSASRPLSVSLFDVNRVDSTLETHPLILQLVAVSQRLRCFKFSGDPELLDPLLRLGPEDVPLLKTILMRTRNTPHTNILQIPTLQELNLTMPSSDPLSLPLPWSQLTSLRLENQRITHTHESGLDFDGAFDILRKCSNLEECRLYITKPSTPLGLPSINLPQLHTLDFTGWEFHFEKWSSGLVAPNLRCLRIGLVIGNNVPGSLAHVSLKADIDLDRFTPSSLLEFLQSLPTISHLRLSSVIYTDRPVSLDDEFMALFGPPHNLCPMLTHITLLPHSTGFSDAAALAFIRARMAMPTPLQRFEANFRRQMELNIMPELQSFISDGLKVVVGYAPAPWKFKPQNGLDKL
ncbi:hypothetical protein MSAN_01033600 [Mycena sanguinolenta]|uniref:F-box domain-containing protein n=1 Tax=Mycena sanguinolenta TaxID=230812 RepID=A0A8H6YPF5_9AGAR|nr:hypothetical protein MSAN_01033600 [Mycena sanguinolenta]